MMAAIDMLAAVRALGGEVKLANSGRLKVVAPAPLPNELIEQLRAAKTRSANLALIPGITNRAAGLLGRRRGGTRCHRGVRCRRAARFGEGFPRLDPNDAPADVPPRRWLGFIDDCGRFLDGGWARQAAAFGWDRWICLAAIGNGHSLASIMPACFGSSTAGS